MDITKFTEEELKARLEELQRDKEPKLPDPSDRPGVLHNARNIAGHFDPIIKMAERIIDEIMDGSYHEDNDDAYYMYETAIELVYGKRIWDFINANS